MDYTDYPRPVVEDIARLRRRITASGIPEKHVDANLLIGTWNIRGFGRVFDEWTENPGSPKRNLRAMACIAEVVRRFDVMAIQEVKRDTSGLRLLVDGFLGPNWGVVLSDVTAGDAGNGERLTFVYDKRRVTPSGLAGEIVLSAHSRRNAFGAVRSHALHRGLHGRFTRVVEGRALCAAHGAHQVRQPCRRTGCPSCARSRPTPPPRSATGPRRAARRTT